MGSGKSSLGQALAKELELPFFDLDKEIEMATGCSISETILIKGEFYFRKIERQKLMDLLEHEEFVLSTGGGTPCYYDNMDLINKKSLSIYLQYSVSQLYERLEGKQADRPLIAHLKNEALKEYIGKHLFERAAFYEKAILQVKAGSRSVDDLLHEIKTFTHE